jgi:hypothetical protein
LADISNVVAQSRAILLGQFGARTGVVKLLLEENLSENAGKKRGEKHGKETHCGMCC